MCATLRCCVGIDRPQTLSCRICCPRLIDELFLPLRPTKRPPWRSRLLRRFARDSEMNQCTWASGLHRTVQLAGTSQPFPDQSGMASCSATPGAAPFVRPITSRLFFLHFSSRRASLLRWLLRGFLNLRPRSTNPPWPISSQDAKNKFEGP